MTTNNKPTIAQPEEVTPTVQAQLDALQARVEQLEMDSLACLKYMRHRAEEEAKLKDPSFQPLGRRPEAS